MTDVRTLKAVAKRRQAMADAEMRRQAQAARTLAREEAAQARKLAAMQARRFHFFPAYRKNGKLIVSSAPLTYARTHRLTDTIRMAAPAAMFVHSKPHANGVTETLRHARCLIIVKDTHKGGIKASYSWDDVTLRGSVGRDAPVQIGGFARAVRTDWQKRERVGLPRRGTSGTRAGWHGTRNGLKDHPMQLG